MKTINHDVTVKLTREGKLPTFVHCLTCSGEMRLLKTRTKPTYFCSKCKTIVTLYPTKKQREQIRK